jgi:hypothetical protein
VREAPSALGTRVVASVFGGVDHTGTAAFAEPNPINSNDVKTAKPPKAEIFNLRLCMSTHLMKNGKKNQYTRKNIEHGSNFQILTLRNSLSAKPELKLKKSAFSNISLPDEEKNNVSSADRMW